MDFSPEDVAEMVDRDAHDEVIELFQRGVSVNAADQYGRTALMYTILRIDGAKLESVQFLLDQGAEPNASDKGQEWTPLHFAARGNRLDLVKALLAKGAKIDAVDVFGNTPLWRCAMNCGDDFGVVTELLEAGADPTMKNHHDISPLDSAITRGNDELVEILRKEKQG